MVSMGLLPGTNALLEVVELRPRRRDAVLAQLVAAAEQAGAVREPEVLLSTLARAHRLGGAAVGHDVAVPHARSICVVRPISMLGRSERGIEWSPGDGGLVHLVMLVLSPAAFSAAAHAERLALAVQAFRLQRVRHKLLEAESGNVRTVLEETARR